jgi:DNA modification methylase
MHIRDRIRGLLSLPSKRIRPNPKNWRTHPAAQRDALRGVLADVGVVDTALVRVVDAAALAALRSLPENDDASFARWAAAYKGDYMLVDGHLRVEELQQQNQDIKVLVLDLDEPEAAEVLATLDPIGDLAGMNRDMFLANIADFDTTNAALKTLFADLAGVEGSMRAQAAANGETVVAEANAAAALVNEAADEAAASADRAEKKENLAQALAQAAADEDPVITPTQELQAKWGTAIGQLWIIPSKTGEGSHRLICGDSTDPATIKRLMNGQQAVLLHTDPPYGVDYVKTKGGIPGFSAGNFDDIANDDLKDTELQGFLQSVLQTASPHLASNAPLYFWHPGGPLSAMFTGAMLAEDYLVHRQIIWSKPHMVLTRSGMYHWKHEPCYYGWKKGNPPPWYGDKSQTSVWTDDRDSDKGMHPTQKPVGLFVRPISNHVKEGEICLEPFSGSGSQMLAAEQLGRLCYAMELHPGYVAVLLERLTARGLTPVLST